MQTAIAKTKEKYGDSENFLKQFNPDKQILASKNLERSYLGIAPTLTTVVNAYGYDVLEVWIMAQLENLNDFCGANVKIEIPQMSNLVKIIFSEYYYLKISELLLFFYRLKAGEYGHFYGSIDPQKITVALLEFKRRRIAEIQYYELKKQNEEKNKLREEWAKNSVTREQYEQMKRAENK